MSILVTGATGFVGTGLLTALRARGTFVRPAMRQQTASEAGAVTVGEVDRSTDWMDALRGISHVVHLAARVHVMRNQTADPLQAFREVNTEGTVRLARQAAEAGVSRFVYVSTVKVQGESTSDTPLREVDPAQPGDAYAISKWEAEQQLMKIASQTKLEVVIIRPPLVYGPGVKANFLSMIQWIHSGAPLPLGAIHNKRSLVALDNLVDLIVTCIEDPAAANQTFLVSDGEDLSTSELIRRLGAVLGKPPWLLPIPAWILKSGAALVGKGSVAQRLTESLQVDIRKTRELLDWSPPVGVDEGLRKTARYFLEHQTK